MKTLNKHFNISCTLVFAMLLFTTQTILAQSGSVAGHVSYHELYSTSTNGDKGTVIQQAINVGTIVSQNAKSPFHLSKQTCSGTNILNAQGQPLEAAGSCDVIDAEGDICWMTYHNKPNGENVWEIVGGTGKYQNMSGGGTTTPISMSPDGKMLTITYEGSFKMKPSQ